MTFYQELQLSSTGSKELIKKTTDPKEKRRHILIYNVKVYLVVAFCFALVTLFSAVFGSGNSVAGVVVLLALLVYCRNFRDSYHRAEIYKHFSPDTCIFCKSCLYYVTDDFRLP